MNATFATGLLYFLLSILPALAQAPDPLGEKWFSRFASTAGLHDVPTAIATDPLGDVYVAGVTKIAREWRGIVLKFAADSGALLWRWESSNVVPDEDFSSPPMDARIAIGPDGNPIALFRRGNQLVKLLSGNALVEWSVPTDLSELHGYSGNLDYDMTIDAAGDVFAVGAGSGAMVAKFSGADGALRWHYQPAGLFSPTARAVATNAAGDVIVSGAARAGPLPEPSQTFTAWLDGITGAVQWTKLEPAISTSYSPAARLLLIDRNGDVLVATYNSRLLKYQGLDGSPVWQQSFQGSPYDLVTDDAGDVYLATDSRCMKFAAATGAISWVSSISDIAPVTALVRGNELVVLSHTRGMFMLHAFDLRNGASRWYRLSYSGQSKTRVISKAMTLMTPQGTDRIVYTGAIADASGGYDIGVASYGPGPSLGAPVKNWVLPTRVQLRVTADGNFRPGTIRCEYGLTSDYDQTSPSRSLGTSVVQPGSPYSFTLEGLAEDTLYHARFVAQTDRGTAVSASFTFTTNWDANENKLPDEWELAHWGNTSSRSAAEDEDRDGLNSLVEYALGKNPRKSDSAGALPIVIDAEDRLSITLPKRPYVTVRAEVSGDLKTWSPGEIAGEDEATITLRDVLPKNRAPARFLRVRATSQ